MNIMLKILRGLIINKFNILMILRLKNKISKIFTDPKKFEKGIDKFLKRNNYQLINQTNKEDIFIAGYPKSGNTWVQNLITGALFGIDTAFLPDSLTQEVIPDVHIKVFYKRFFETCFFKTHDLPNKNMKRVVHLVRDGRDVMASYYAMNKALDIDCTLDDMIIKGQELFPSKWHIHTRKWLENPFGAEIILVKYEDLIENPEKELKRILDFANINRSEDIISRSVKGNSFEEMRKKEESYGWDNKSWNTDKKFIRKGKIGAFKTEIPSHLISYFQKESQLELNQLGYILTNDE